MDEYIPQLTLTPDLSAQAQPEVKKEEDLITKAQAAPEAGPDLSALSPAEQQAVLSFAKQIDLENAQQVLEYGASAQKNIADFSDTALAKVKTGDLGEIGTMLSGLLVELKTLEEPEKKGIAGLFRKAKINSEELKARFSTAEVNVDRISGELEKHKVTLLKDVAVMDQMYDRNLQYFKELTMYILAGKQKLAEARSTTLRELREKTDEFTQVTGSMREGLVLLDEHGDILSINAAAQALFGADGQCTGQDFLTVERSHEISAAIQAAAGDGHSEVRAERAGRVYQFDISRIASDGKPIGTVILAFDITEQEFAERNRREFTANVSHELKTPLQGIIGSAELIENGMVKPDDLPRFVGHIHTEAARLVTLIDDIIRLSQLDEGGELPTEPVDLLTVSQEAAETLQDAAAARQVTVSVQGEPAVIPGVRRLLYEIVYNLCDNAIKYNRDGGRVDITVAHDADGSSVTVADTGIGIAPEHQARVFERFYRVDKSHSKASGGTGLGLSIVKHAMQLHHGRIELESTPGTGTTIRAIFPKA